MVYMKITPSKYFLTTSTMAQSDKYLVPDHAFYTAYLTLHRVWHFAQFPIIFQKKRVEHHCIVSSALLFQDFQHYLSVIYPAILNEDSLKGAAKALYQHPKTVSAPQHSASCETMRLSKQHCLE